MRVGGYSFRLVNISCLPSDTRFNALVELEHDVSEVMPYLNAVINGGHYSQADRIFDFMHDGHIVTVLPRQMKITGVTDEADARRVIEALRDLIERVWARRESIEPRFETRPRGSPVAVLRGLPRTNCGDCGVPTCLAFATRVVRGLAGLEECPHTGRGG